MRRGFWKRIRSTSPAVRRTTRHIPLLTVKLHLAKEQVEAVVHTRASTSVVGKRLACKLGIWKRVRTVKVRQEDGSFLGRDFVIDTIFKVIDSSLVLYKFAVNAEV